MWPTPEYINIVVVAEYNKSPTTENCRELVVFYLVQISSNAIGGRFKIVK